MLTVIEPGRAPETVVGQHEIFKKTQDFYGGSHVIVETVDSQPSTYNSTVISVTGSITRSKALQPTPVSVCRALPALWCCDVFACTASLLSPLPAREGAYTALQNAAPTL